MPTILPTYAQSLRTPACDHCKTRMAFGTFRVRLVRDHQEKLMALCADCGFNITNLRVSRLAQIKETDSMGRLAPKEFMYTFRPYESCTLLEVFTEAQQLLIAHRDAERREAEEARQQKISARRAAMPPRPEVVVRQPSIVSPRRKVATA